MVNINRDALTRGLLGAILISLGLIFSEKAIEPGADKYSGIIGALLFVIGWILFLSAQPWSVMKFGIIVPIIAAFGQVYMGWLLKKDSGYIKDKLFYTMSFWMIFLIVWLVYVYKMTEGRDNKLYVYGGLLMVLGSMMGYFFYRDNDWHKLSGGLIPSISKSSSIFNPFVILFPLGWSALAVGNAIQ